MRFTVHQVRTFEEHNPVYLIFDSMDDRYMAGFDNYPSPSYTLVVAEGHDWPQVVAVLVGNVITAFVVSDDVSNRHFRQVWDELTAHLQTLYTWLIFHDADDEGFGQRQGFVQVAPPEDVEDPVIVVTWGDLLAPINTIFALQGLTWDRAQHRSGRGRSLGPADHSNN
jgi:hypothetical protein